MTGTHRRATRRETRGAYRSEAFERFRFPLAILLLVVMAAVATRFAYAAIFSIFQPYDDEGFHLITLRSYLDGGSIYEDVFAQYGPFYYQLMGALFRVLGSLPTHDTGRMVTLSLWIGGSLLLGYALYRLTGRLLAGLVVQMGVYITLFTLVNEPMHPGGLLIFLLIAIVAVAVLVLPRKEGLGMFLVGLFTMAAVFVKINAGGFAVIAVVFTAAIVFPTLASKRVLRILAGLLLVATPYALMLGDLDQEWARRYALLVAMAALGVVVTTARIRPSRTLGARELGWLAGGMATAALLVPAILFAQGTSPTAFLQGSLINPLEQPDIFTLPLQLPLLALLPGVLSLLVALLAPRLAGSRDSWELVSGLARLAAGLLILLGILGPAPFQPLSLWLALPLTWVSLPPVLSERHRFAHVLIPSLAVLQGLHAYPVAGSQVGWSAFLLIPVGAIAVVEGEKAVAAALGSRVTSTRLRNWITGIPFLVLAVWLTLSALPWLRGFEVTYRNNRGVELAGASRLRLSEDQGPVLRDVSIGLERECSTFVSLPGLNSFYLFAEQDPPTGLNQSGWMYVFDRRMQSRIVRAIAPVEGLCAIRNVDLLAFWQQGRPPPRGPLVRYIETAFDPVQRWGGYELLVKREG